MVLRFEDTDRERSKKEFEDDILQNTDWLGLKYFKPAVFRQSERTEIYKKHLIHLIEKGSAYEAEESTATPGMRVVRFKNPNRTVTFHDAIRGEVSFDTTELGDFVIARSHDLPLYHLAVVIDDAEAGVTHVIRGEDHLSNTQRQILLIESLSFNRPEYAHIPLILAADRTKLSKRHGAVSLTEYRAQGFIPEAILNYLALLGWNPGGDQEVFTLEELVEKFSLERIHKGGAIFDIEKLKWFNREHLKYLSDGEFAKRLGEYASRMIDPKLVFVAKERAETLKEAVELYREVEEMLNGVHPTREMLLKNTKSDPAEIKWNMAELKSLLAQLDEDFTKDTVDAKIMKFADEKGRGNVLGPLRVALWGKEKSPGPFIGAQILGKEKTLERIEKAAQML